MAVGRPADARTPASLSRAVQGGQDGEHRARQAAAVRAGFHKEAAMSRQLARRWKLPRHRGVFP